jgi:uncharacterized protein involved in exopolysaccharide biosynthesis
MATVQERRRATEGRDDYGRVGSRSVFRRPADEGPAAAGCADEIAVSSLSDADPLEREQAVEHHAARPSPQDYDLRFLRRLLARNMLLLIACFLTGAVLGFVLGVMQAPVYRAETVVTVAMDETTDARPLGAFGGFASLAGFGMGGGGGLHADAVLESKAFTEQFIVDHNLLPLLYRGLWDEEASQWLSEVEDPPSVRDARRRLAAQRSVKADPLTGLITLSIDWTDPQEAADWANQMIVDVNDLLRRKALKEAELALAYLESKLESVAVVEIRETIYPLIEQQMSKAALANIREEYALRVIDPALPPDLDHNIRPNPPFMAIIGGMLGLLMGLTIVMTLRASKD